ncbi:MAG: type II toxin-antitoxin system PemK/MazF family toxin [Bilifractor sp.]|jgi:mRNA interferase MazF
MVKQGDIILIDFDPSIGHEQKKMRPALVVSTNTYHKYCKDFAILCPISHANNFPLNIPLSSGLQTTGKVLCGHLRYMDINARTYQYIESVDRAFLHYILQICQSFFES